MLTIVSGGQTGVDRAALDAAIACGLAYTGWCPKGGWAEDMAEPPGVRAVYPALRETAERAPGQRTDWNVRDANALMVLVNGRGLAASKGSERAARQAETLGRPHIVIDLEDPGAPMQAKDFLSAQAGQAVCIAGPRESEAPGIYAKARAFLEACLAP